MKCPACHGLGIVQGISAFSQGYPCGRCQPDKPQSVLVVYHNEQAGFWAVDVPGERSSIPICYRLTEAKALEMARKIEELLDVRASTSTQIRDKIMDEMGWCRLRELAGQTISDVP